MEPQLQTRPRRAIPVALVLSILVHGTLTGIFATRPEWLFPTEPPPPPEPIPVPFVPAPRPVKPQNVAQPAHRYEFPDAPASKEKVHSDIKSDRDRKAQTRDPSKMTMPAPPPAVARPRPAQPAPVAKEPQAPPA